MGRVDNKPRDIKRIVIANRGEIARRIIHSVRASGREAIALYAENDRNSPFVLEADFSFCLGEGNLQETYLNLEQLIKTAKLAKADAVHPGYGFLSENAAFAKAVEDEGFIFIGPKPEHIEIMGDKLKARAWAKKQGIPLVPGFETTGKDLDQLKVQLNEHAYPFLIKAAAGGGGKGMKIVNKESELKASIQSASREAEKAFSDGRVYIEKWLESPRHIEVQLLSDEQGHHIHLFNRDCSLQRRYQKVIEEAPAPFLSEKVSGICYDAALKIAKGLNYRGLGTIEFVVSGEHAYFLEMNTRLQVEHPVTEMITGLDLVALQIDVAEGKKLPFQQSDIKINGHAIEARLYAENPEKQFLPSTGKIDRLQIPPWQGVRLDMGYADGLDIRDCYDPLIGKIIAHGRNREEARMRLQQCMMHSKIKGTITNLTWLSHMLIHPDFIDMKIDTQYLDRQGLEESVPKSNREKALIAAAFLLSQKGRVQVTSKDHKIEGSSWSDGRLSGFRNI